MAAAVMAAALGLAGCGGIDGVELQGGIFDALGVSGSGKPETKNVNVAARPGLVLPPSEQALPPPDEASPAPSDLAGQSWPIDPEQNRARAQSEIDRQHKEYCERAIQDAEIRKETGVIVGPKGNCQTSIFGSLNDLAQGSKQ